MHSWAARLKEKFCTNDDGEMKVLKTEMNCTWTVKLRHKGEGEMNLVLAAQIKKKLRVVFVKDRRASGRKGNVECFCNIWYCKRFRKRDYYKQNFFSLMYNVSTYIVTNVRSDMQCAGDVGSFNWINQPDPTTSQVYYLSLKYSSTCFGHPHAHQRELQQLQ